VGATATAGASFFLPIGQATSLTLAGNFHLTGPGEIPSLNFTVSGRP
jgi:hypothetical protein